AGFVRLPAGSTDGRDDLPALPVANFVVPHQPRYRSRLVQRTNNWQRVGNEGVYLRRARRLQPAEKVRCIVAVGSPTYSQKEHAGCTILASPHLGAIGIPLDNVFSLGILRTENEIENDLVIFWILNDCEIDGWIGRLTLVEHTDLGSNRAVDIDPPHDRFDQQHSLETFAHLTRRQIFLLVIVGPGVR